MRYATPKTITAFSAKSRNSMFPTLVQWPRKADTAGICPKIFHAPRIRQSEVDCQRLTPIGRQNPVSVATGLDSSPLRLEPLQQSV